MLSLSVAIIVPPLSNLSIDALLILFNVSNPVPVCIEVSELSIDIPLPSNCTDEIDSILILFSDVAVIDFFCFYL